MPQRKIVKIPTNIRRQKLQKPVVFSQAGGMPVREQKKPRPIPFSISPQSMGSITVQVCQGVGDIFWVYQKFAPYVNKINFRVMVIDKNDVQLRAIEWLKIWPKTGRIDIVYVKDRLYSTIAQSYPSMQSVWQQYRTGKPISYACNKWLETGTRLDEIDVGAAIESNVALQLEPTDIPFDKYICLYVSGSSSKEYVIKDPALGVWSIDKWVELIHRTYEKHGLNLPIVLPGANFDEITINPLGEKLEKSGIKTHKMIQQTPSKVLAAIKGSQLFVGYQSGLNIMADNMDVKQLMLYFNYLEPMKYTWCKRKNINTLFNASLFRCSPEEVVKEHNLL